MARRKKQNNNEEFLNQQNYIPNPGMYNNGQAYMPTDQGGEYSDMSYQNPPINSQVFVGVDPNIYQQGNPAPDANAYQQAPIQAQIPVANTKVKKPAGAFSRIIRIFLWVILAVFLIFETYYYFQYFANNEKLPMVLGYGTTVETSGTMSPEIRTMDLCIIERKPVYEIDTIVAFVDIENNVVVHRFLGIDHNGMYRTKGDANSVSDSPIEGDQIKGEVVSVIPFGGFLYNPVSEVTFALILILLLVFCYRWKAKRNTSQ